MGDQDSASEPRPSHNLTWCPRPCWEALFCATCRVCGGELPGVGDAQFAAPLGQRHVAEVLALQKLRGGLAMRSV